MFVHFVKNFDITSPAYRYLVLTKTRLPLKYRYRTGIPIADKTKNWKKFTDEKKFDTLQFT
jgi:hypothetical protein